MGYWKPTLAVSTGVADLRPLLEEEPTDGAAWRPDRWFRGQLIVSQGNGMEPTIQGIEGTLRAVEPRAEDLARRRRLARRANHAAKLMQIGEAQRSLQAKHLCLRREAMLHPNALRFAEAHVALIAQGAVARALKLCRLTLNRPLHPAQLEPKLLELRLNAPECVAREVEPIVQPHFALVHISRYSPGTAAMAK
jgi:hypothetical protein